jgi:Excalibur calcium-binding domain
MRKTIGIAMVAAVIAGFAAQPVVARDYDCSDFSSWRQAQRFFKNHHPRRDPFRLDADHDGIACESLR